VAYPDILKHLFGKLDVSATYMGYEQLNSDLRYSTQMVELFTEVYNQLPLCHCINNKVLVSFALKLNQKLLDRQSVQVLVKV
jgi:hypothetical protein